MNVPFRQRYGIVLVELLVKAQHLIAGTLLDLGNSCTEYVMLVSIGRYVR